MLLKAFYSKNVSLRHLPTEFQAFKSVRKSFDLIVQNAMYLLFLYSLDFLLNFWSTFNQSCSTFTHTSSFLAFSAKREKLGTTKT